MTHVLLLLHWIIKSSCFKNENYLLFNNYSAGSVGRVLVPAMLVYNVKSSLALITAHATAYRVSF